MSVLSLADAQKRVRLEGIQTLKAYATYAAQQPSDVPQLPLNPEEWYGSDFPGWTTFLKASRRQVRGRQFLSFEEARALVQSLNIATVIGFKEALRDKILPDTVPTVPANLYAEQWQGWDDFLGTTLTHYVRKAEALPFEAARTFAQTLRLRSRAEWVLWRGAHPEQTQLPALPEQSYKDSGWAGWADFLGVHQMLATGVRQRDRNNRIWPFARARAYVSALGFKTRKEFTTWVFSSACPPQIPSDPSVAYNDSGWQGWPHFLQKGRAQRLRGAKGTTYMPYGPAKLVLRELGIPNNQAYAEHLTQGKLPSTLPPRPEDYYGAEWVSWNDFLGRHHGGFSGETPAMRPDGFLNFADAKSYVQKLTFKSLPAFLTWAAGRERPAFIPREPWKTYMGQGFKSIEDFLGLRA